MTYNLINYDGFEKYGPVSDASTFTVINATNFGTNNNSTLLNQSFTQEWTSSFLFGNPSAGIITGLNGSGRALCIIQGSSGPSGYTRNLPANYSRVIFGFAFMTNLVNQGGINFVDAGNNVQSSIWIDTSGRINFSRASAGNTPVLYTSSALILTNTRYYLEIDLTTNSSTGRFQIWLNGTSLTTLTSQNTQTTSNAYINQFQVTTGTGSAGKFAWDDMYWQDNTAGTYSPLGDCTIDALSPASDSSIQFSITASKLGPWFYEQTNNQGTQGTGGNVVWWMPVTPSVAKTLNSVSFLAYTTNGAANFRGVVYSDSSGNPGSLLSTGPQVTGVTNAIPLTLPLTTPQTLTANTQYWIGFITDSNVAIVEADNWSNKGKFQSVTYTSGAPATASPGGSVNTWMVWGNCTGNASSFENVANNAPPPINSIGTLIAYNQDNTVGHEDLFRFTALPTIPTAIYAVKISTFAAKSDVGARTFTNQVKSGAVDSSGVANTLLTSPIWFSDIYPNDPNTSSAWSATAVNALTAGYKIAS